MKRALILRVVYGEEHGRGGDDLLQEEEGDASEAVLEQRPLKPALHRIARVLQQQVDEHLEQTRKEWSNSLTHGG
jgi:hypothetical protein|tara:strand:- start:405 stop:629 length:225 start_codon:yes stop_codon:yes gene_type:complete